jgi:16S rRNA (uracil1498-N3)-methyltransferase
MAQEIRLYTAQPLEKGAGLALGAGQSHYLANVMRAKAGEYVSLFNGRDGQWQAEITSIGKKSVSVTALRQERPQAPCPDLWLAFAPIKNKTELVVEKAVELGVSKIISVITRHCVVRSVNTEKLEAHAIEAAEQCERLDVPALETCKDLSYLLGAWEKERILLYGDESGGGSPLPQLLENIKKPGGKNIKAAILIGPEGGFAADEFNMLRACDFAKAFGMGPRILRSDTAAIAALAYAMSRFGDWDKAPHFIGKD